VSRTRRQQHCIAFAANRRGLAHGLFHIGGTLERHAAAVERSARSAPVAADQTTARARRVTGARSGPKSWPCVPTGISTTVAQIAQRGDGPSRRWVPFESS